VKVGVCKSDIR